MPHPTRSFTILAHRRTYRPRGYAEVFVGVRGHETNPQDRSGGLPDRPGVPTDCPSRQISIGTGSYARERWSGSVLKRSSYIALDDLTYKLDDSSRYNRPVYCILVGVIRIRL